MTPGGGARHVAPTRRVVRVVVVSPSDVGEERDIVETVIAELNGFLAPQHGLDLELWRWETGATPGLHKAGAQGKIDEEMRITDADVVVGMFWTRFGTPVDGDASGTEHELKLAWESWRTSGRPDVMLYFRESPALPRDAASCEQWAEVFRLRGRIPSEQLWGTYATVRDFERRVRDHLQRFVMAQARGRADDRAPRQRRSSVWTQNVPLCVKPFIGRSDELAELEAKLAADQRPVAIVVITGTEGVGKTTLAARYVEERGGDYDVVAWIDAAKGDGVADLGALGSALGLDVGRLHPEEAADEALQYLATCDDHWLLVVDGARDLERLMRTPPRFGSRGHVVATSHDRGFGDRFETVSLKPFGEQLAVDYLLTVTGRDDRAGAHRVAQAVGGLPLALNGPAAACRGKRTFDEFLHQVSSLPADELFPALTVASTVRPSIHDAIAEAPSAADVLAMAAHLGPTPIPRSLFDVLVDDAGPVAERRLDDGFTALERYSVADIDPEGALIVPTLIQKTVRDDHAVRGDLAPGRRALTAVEAAFPDDPADRACWGDIERLLPHLLALADSLASAPETARVLIELRTRACLYLNWDERPRRAVEIAEQTALDSERQLGRLDPLTVRAKDTQAYVYWALGRVDDALPIQRFVLAERMRQLGTEDVETLDAANHLAYSYWSLGNADESIPLQEWVLHGREEHLGPEHPATLIARHELSMSYRLAGRLDEAVAMQEALLKDRDRILGPLDQHTIRTRLERALSHRDAQEYDQAAAALERVVNERSQVLGKQHLHTVFARYELACTYLLMPGRRAEAIELLRQVVERRTLALGDEHRETQLSRAALDRALAESGDEDEEAA